MTNEQQEPMTGGQVEVVDNTDGRFYELSLDGEPVGMLVYERAGARRVLTHTTIKEKARGRGLAGVLIRHALDDLAAKDATITIFCPIVDVFIEKNPEYERLIDTDHPGNWRTKRH